MLELRKHQVQGVELARKIPHVALFFEAGTGKTGTMVRILAEHFNGQKGIKPTLIFAPLTVCSQWPGEFEKFSKIPQEHILVLTGPGKKRTAQLQRQIDSGKPAIVVTNYEAVQIKEFYALLLKWSPEVVVCDESHRLKDSQSKRAKAIYPLCYGAKRRFLLTGTPQPNSLLDIFGQYKALDPNIFGPGFWSFRNRYFYDKNAGRQFSYPDWVPQPWAAQEIGQVLAKTSLQVKLTECIDLPPLSEIPVEVPLSSAQKRAYEEMKKDFLTEVQGHVTSSEFEMVKTLRMQQILAGFIQPDKDDGKGVEPIWFDDVPRLDALEDLLDSIGKERSIIWTTFKPTYKKIGKLLEKLGIPHAFLTGEQSHMQKVDAIADFKEGSVQCLVANPAAASEGINLQEARYAIYYFRGYNLTHYLQSKARNYRSGTEKLHGSVVHYHLVTKGSLDEVIMKALESKQSMAEAVLAWAKVSSCKRQEKQLASLSSPG